MQKQEIAFKQQLQATDSHWSEHIKTLMAFELQFVYRIKPDGEQNELANDKKPKKKKNIQYESAFLFSGRKQNKEIQPNIQQLIMNSHCNFLKKLFKKNSPEEKKEGMSELKKMIKIMLELKHSTIVQQFMELYEEIAKKIEAVTFVSVKQEEPRRIKIKDISQEIAHIIKTKSRDPQTSPFKSLATYLNRNEKQMIEFLKVNIYCFLAELHNFNINEYYATAFTFQQEERKVPKKKRKTQ